MENMWMHETVRAAKAYLPVTKRGQKRTSMGELQTVGYI